MKEEKSKILPQPNVQRSVGRVAKIILIYFLLVCVHDSITPENLQIYLKHLSVDDSWEIFMVHNATYEKKPKTNEGESVHCS